MPKPNQPEDPTPAEPVISLNTFLAHGARVNSGQRAVLTALHAAEKHTRAGWTALAADVLNREVTK